MFTEHEMAVLNKFRSGGRVEEEDRILIHEKAGMSLVRLGFAEKNGEIYETASLTSLGKRLLQRDQIRSNPVREFIYNLLHCVR